MPFFKSDSVKLLSEARRKLAEVLEQAESTGKVLIRRKDGRTFALAPVTLASSPLDVPSVATNVSTEEVVNIVREGREMGEPRRPA